MNGVTLYNLIWIIFTLGQLIISLAMLIGIFFLPMVILYFAFLRKQKPQNQTFS